MITINYIKKKQQNQAEEINQAGYIKGFGEPGNFIGEINIPDIIEAGSEFISMTNPIIRIVGRKKFMFKDFFKKSSYIEKVIIEDKEKWKFNGILKKSFYYPIKKIKIQFHWEGIEIVGSYMESPNKFELPVEKNYEWFFKVICKGDAKAGFKSLYLSIDTIHENLVTKFISKFLKIVSITGLVGIIAIGLFFNDTTIGEKLFFDKLGGDVSLHEKATVLSPYLISLVLFLGYWKNVSDFFESFNKIDDSKLSTNTNYQGIKAASDKIGITVT